MSKKAADLKYPMVDLLTGATMSLMYFNMLTVSNLFLLGTPWLCMEAWMKGREGGSMASVQQKEPLSDNRQIAPGERPARSTILIASAGDNDD
jgi:hypothetical protein